MLSDAGKRQQLINAMDSPVGQEFIKRLMARIERNRTNYDSKDINSSALQFAEARAKYSESFDLLQEFLSVVENQEKVLNLIQKDMTK